MEALRRKREEIQVAILVGYVLALLFAPSALADTVGVAQSYTLRTPDGRFVFVMLSPASADEEVAGLNRAAETRARVLRQTYAVSGMYEAGATDEPIWRLHGYVSNAVVVDEHIVVGYEDVVADASDEVLQFYEDGALRKSLRLKDVMDFPFFAPRSISHRWWLDGIGLTGETVTLRTLHYERLTFDAASGELVSSARPIRIVLLVVVGLLLAGTAAGIAWLRRRAHTRTDSPH